MLGEVKMDLVTYNNLANYKTEFLKMESDLAKAEQLTQTLIAYIVNANIANWSLKTDTYSREDKLNPFSGGFIVHNLEELLALGIKLEEIVYHAGATLEAFEALEENADD